MTAIGIDLGTTNCCMAIVKNGIPEIIETPKKHRLIPSYIRFEEGEIFVGESGKKLCRDATSIVYDVKRFIGHDYKSQVLEEYKERWRFNLVNVDNKLKVAIKKKDEVVHYTPEELSSFVLKELKEIAENQLKITIPNVVITVPTHFSDQQRQATIDAGKLAGFESIKLLNEPTAAAIAYGHHNKIKGNSVFLIFDFGGGTFDISVIKCEDDVYDAVGIDGDLNLGGVDIDNKIFDYIKRTLGIEPSEGSRMMYRLKTVSEKTKIELSSLESTTVEIAGEDEFVFKRKKFNELNEDIFKKTIDVVNRCIERIEINKSDISHIVLVGGSTRIPKIQELLENYFQKPVKCNINPDEAVAMGAAIIAAKTFDSKFSTLEFKNICPNSLGVEVKGGKMSVLIPKYSKIPCKVTKTYGCEKPDQKIVNIKIYCGEDELIQNNKFLGNFKINIPKELQDPILNETFEINEDGILVVTATNGLDTASKKLQITLENGNLTMEELEEYKKKINADLELCREFRDFKIKKNELEQICSNLKKSGNKEYEKTEIWLKNIEVTKENKQKMDESIKQLKNRLQNKNQTT